jgi:hypothetical protein
LKNESSPAYIELKNDVYVEVFYYFYFYSHNHSYEVKRFQCRVRNSRKCQRKEF